MSTPLHNALEELSHVLGNPALAWDDTKETMESALIREAINRLSSLNGNGAEPERIASYFHDVGAFHARMGFPVTGNTRIGLLTFEDFGYRRDAMMEELFEFTDAHARSDYAEALDALVDLAYFVFGTAHWMGAPFHEAWTAVHNANMLKRPWQEGDPIKPRSRKLSGKILDAVKPEGWRAPDIHDIVEKFALTLRTTPRRVPR